MALQLSIQLGYPGLVVATEPTCRHPPRQIDMHEPCLLDLVQCLAVCPAGYGRIAEGDLPDWWDRTQVPVRRLLQLQELSSNTSTAAYSPDLQHVQYSNITQWQQEDEQQQEVTTLGLPMPPPAWATDCLPCPINFFSPGGAIGFAECKVCPAGWTTGNASASADCMGKDEVTWLNATLCSWTAHSIMPRALCEKASST